MSRSIIGSQFAKASHLGNTIKSLAAEARLRNAVDLAEDSALATVTEATAYDAALTYRVRVGTNGGTSGNTGFVVRPEWFRFGGGKTVIATEHPGQSSGTGVRYSGYDITAYQFLSVELVSGGSMFAGYASAASWAWSVEFMFDGAEIDLVCLARGSQNYRLLVNNQYVSKTGGAWGGNGVRMLNLVFPDRRPRRIRLEGTSFAGFCGINAAPGDSVWAPPARPRVAAIGDSLTVGNNATYLHDSYAQVAGKLMGIDFSPLADGGTGFVATDAGTGYKFADRLGSLAYETYDLAMFAGGYNDYAVLNAGTTYLSAIQAGVEACITGTRALYPSLPIVLLGAHPGATGPNANLLAVENAIQAGASAVNDPLTLFVPMSSGTTPWLFGTGKAGATNGSGNTDNYVDTDGVHLVNAGHVYKGRRLERAFLTRVVPWLCGAA